MSLKPSDASMVFAGLRCPECGYNLQGLPEARCPECGRHFDPNEPMLRESPICRKAGSALPVMSLCWALTMVGYACILIYQQPVSARGGRLHIKLEACFLSPYLFSAMLVWTGLSGTIGWPALREARIRTGRLRFGLIVSGLVFISGYLSSVLFSPGAYTHSLYGWELVDYVQTMGGNLLMSMVPTTVVLMVQRPWLLVPKVSVIRVACMAWAVLLLCYGFSAVMSLPIFGPVLVE
jgi:hypothetical protein